MSDRKRPQGQNEKTRAIEDYPTHIREVKQYTARFKAWQAMFEKPNKEALYRIAELLARLGFEPDEYGVPIGNWPAITKTDVRVFLDHLAESVGPGERREKSLTWKNNVISIAKLVWAGAIELDPKQIEDASQTLDFGTTVSCGDIAMLVAFCDLDGFFKHQSFSFEKAKVRESWKNDPASFLRDPDATRKMLTRKRRKIT